MEMAPKPMAILELLGAIRVFGRESILSHFFPVTIRNYGLTALPEFTAAPLAQTA